MVPTLGNVVLTLTFAIAAAVAAITSLALYAASVAA
jgi:hypothetical protein